ncbi:uncharacterized protein LOC144162228 [Haemaphysalis longicornis]
MPPVVLRYGFARVNSPEEFLRESLLSKGRKLCTASYVYNAEESDPHEAGGPRSSRVTAKCNSQVKDMSYDVAIQLSSERKIVSATCSCKAGLGGRCKHVAAVVVFLNTDRPSSTDLPQAWGRRTSKPDTSKKESIEDLFGEYKPTYVGGKRPRQCEPGYVLQHFPDVSCSMNTALRVELQGESERAVHDVLENLCAQAAFNADLCSVKEVLLRDDSFPLYGTHLGSQICPSAGSLALTAEEKKFFETEVACSQVQAEVIAAETITQGKCARWHKERSLRITSSTAHRIISRKRSFDTLAQQLRNSNVPRVDSIVYGLEMEAQARMDFEKKIGTSVTQVGLVVHTQQPWLSASPDGLFKTTNGVTLLEIKCPFTRKDAAIVDAELCHSFVDYIIYEDGCLKLRKNHAYYCQVQVAMYVTNTKDCFFFVYSSKQSVTIVVERDEAFLAATIPQLQHFYCSYYLKQLVH